VRRINHPWLVKNGTSTVYLYVPSQSASSTVARELNTEENRHHYYPRPSQRKEIRQAAQLSPHTAGTPRNRIAHPISRGRLALWIHFLWSNPKAQKVRPAIRVSGSEPAVNEYDLAENQ